MDSTIISIIIAVICVAAGILTGKFIFSKNTRKQIEDATGMLSEQIVRAVLPAGMQGNAASEGARS